MKSNFIKKTGVLRIAALIAAVVFTFGLAACGGGGGGGTSGGGSPPTPTPLILAQSPPQTFTVGATASGVVFTLSDTDNPATVRNKTVTLTWSGAGVFASPPATATTDGSGQFTLDLTGQTVGLAKLTVTLPSPDNRSANCNLNVTAPLPPLNLVQITPQPVSVGATTSVVFTLTDANDPASVQNKTITLALSTGGFASLPATATTDSSGQFTLDLTGQTVGSVTMFAILPDSRAASCDVTVLAAVMPFNLVQNTPQTFFVGAQSSNVAFTLVDTDDPASVRNKTVTLAWSAGAGGFASPPATVTTNSSGQFMLDLTGQSAGSVTMFAILPDGRAASCILTVAASLGLVPNNPTQTYTVGATISGAVFTLSDTENPASVQSKTVTLGWSGSGGFASPPASASTNSSGQFTLAGLTGATDGFVTMTATLPDGRSASCTLVVTSEITGSGTSADPFMIYNASQLKKLASEVNAGGDSKSGVYYKLANNIDLSAFHGGAGWAPIGNVYNRFSGHFDGGGKTISNLYIYLPSNQFVGLFGYIDGATVTNLGVEIAGGGVIGSDYVGGVAGYVNNSTVSNCYTTGNVGITGNVRNYDGPVGGAGGVAGYVLNGVISNCYTTGDVNGDFAHHDTGVGGVAGVVENSTVSDCYATGNVNIPGSGSSSTDGSAGGVVGIVGNSTVSDCYSTGNVSGDYLTGGVVGGDGVGFYSGSTSTTSTITNCYSTGNVSGDYLTGGVAGSFSGSMTNCYATGNVSGGTVGGVAGYFSGSMTNCYATGNVSGGSAGGVAGFVGYNTTLTNCHATGDVSGNNYVGGVAGNVRSYSGSTSTVTNCYATGNVNGGDYVGGVAGSVSGNYGGGTTTVTNCYATGIVSGGNYVGGVAGLVGMNDTNFSSNGSSTVTNCYATGIVSGDSYVGGVAGFAAKTYSDYGGYTHTSTVDNCAALNPAIVRASGSDPSFGRVGFDLAHDNTIILNNVAFAGMTLPAGVTAVSDLNGPHGADISGATATTSSPNYYSGSLGWLFGGADTTPWKWGGASYPLPVLYWQTAEQIAALPPPTHLMGP